VPTGRMSANHRDGKVETGLPDRDALGLEDHLSNELRTQITHHFQAQVGQFLTVNDVADAIGENCADVQRVLRDLVVDGHIEYGAGGCYLMLPPLGAAQEHAGKAVHGKAV